MTVIFLNGAGSSGKSSIAKALVYLSDKPWLTIGIDSFIDMMPSDYTGFGKKASEGFQFVLRQEDGKPAIACESGEFGNKIVGAMSKVVKLLADSGLDLIIDEVLFEDELLKNYALELSSHIVYFVCVKCSLEVMEEREFLRGDRAIGLSRDQYTKVHKGLRPYDLEVDTTSKSSFICATEILEFIEANPMPRGFKRIEKG